jgi:hypothetical protein
MSGGAFEYQQFHIRNIADSIEQEILNSGREKTEEELKWEYCPRDPSWYKAHPEDLKHYEYPPEIIQEFKNAVRILRIAEVYAHRVDYLLSGDDGNESFMSRLKDDLDKLGFEDI